MAKENSNERNAADIENRISTRSLPRRTTPTNRIANCISPGDADALSWETASENAKTWWIELEKANKTRPDLVKKLAQELCIREATLEDFYLICSYSNRIGVRENLKCLDQARQDYKH